MNRVRGVDGVSQWDRVEARSRQFDALVASDLVGIISGEEDRILEANDRFLAMVGRTRSDLVGGLNWVAITPPEYLDTDTQGVQILRTGGRFPIVEKEYYRPDGTRIPVLIGGVMLEPDPYRWVSIVVDLTERKALEGRLVDSERRLHESRLAAALSTVQTLQRSLLPEDLPTVPGVSLAARYLAAEDGEIGGDWYDAFVLSGEHVAVTVGDVAGHGIATTRTMGELRSAARMAAVLDPDPVAVLRSLDTFVRQLAPSLFATALFAVVAPGSGELVWASAGHFPPLLIPADGQARYLDGEVNPPLGTGAGALAPSNRDRLPPQSAVLIFTDGLIERREESIAVGLERLRLAVNGPPPAPGSLCQAVIDGCLSRRVPVDDVCLLAARIEDRA